MYQPNVRITDNLQHSLYEVEEIIKLLRTIPILPIVEERMQREALVETVHYSARIEGNPLDIRTVKRLLEQGPSEVPLDRPEQELKNLSNAMDFIRHIADQTDVPIDEAVIQQIHAHIVRGIPDQGPPGVYKTKQNAIVSRTTRERIFLPSSPSDTAKLMEELGTWLSQSPLAFHSILAAGMAHLELVAIHPFNDGNGRVARALADLILYRYGYKFRYLFSWVRQVGINMSTYHRKLSEVLGPKYGANVDPTTWLEYFAESIAKSLSAKRPYLIDMRDMFIKNYNRGAEIGLSKDQVEAWIFAELFGSVTAGEYLNAKRLSRSTVVKRLKELAELGLLRIVGKGRGVRYVPVPVEETVSEEQQLEMKIAEVTTQ